MNNWYRFFHNEISISLYALLFKRNGISQSIKRPYLFGAVDIGEAKSARHRHFKHFRIIDTPIGEIDRQVSGRHVVLELRKVDEENWDSNSLTC